MSQETAKAALCPTRLIGVCLSVLNTPSPLADVRLPVNMCLCVCVVPHHPSSPVNQLHITWGGDSVGYSSPKKSTLSQLQLIPEKMGLEMDIGMQIQILDGGEILVN